MLFIGDRGSNVHLAVYFVPEQQQKVENGICKLNSYNQQGHWECDADETEKLKYLGQCCRFLQKGMHCAFLD